MRLHVTIDSHEFSAILGTVNIQQQLAGRSSTASFDLAVSVHPDAYDVGAVYDSSVYDGSFATSDVPQQQSEVIITNEATSEKIFRGFITSISRQQRNSTLQVWSISCIGLEYLLENITINRSWTGQTDREIIQDAFGDILPEITTLDATVAELLVAIDFEAKDLTLRELVEQLSKLSGAEWLITTEKALSYRASGSVAAPFGFGSEPSDIHVPPIKKWIIQNRQRSSEAFANKVTLLGAFTGTDGAELRSVAENTASQTELGRVIEAIVVARDVDNQPALDLAAEIELETRAVQETITFDFFDDGLAVGMLVDIISPPADILGSYVINVLTLKQSSPDAVRYTAQVGDYRGTLAERIRQLDRIKNGPKLQPAVAPPTGSIDESMLADGAVTRLKLAAQAVSDAQVDLAGLSRIADLAITETKIADDAISTPKLQANSVDASILSALSVNASHVQVGTLVGNLFQAASITAADAVFATGAIGHADIGSVSATSMTLGTLTVGSGVTIAGTLSVGGGLSVTGTISGSTCNLTDLNASHINTGTLSVGTGGISVSGNISGALLDDGTVAAVKISSVDAGTITTGTLAVGSGGITVTGNISGAILDDGTVSAVKISSVDASTINAGTITAAISINSGGNFVCTDVALFHSGVTINGLLSVSNDIAISGHDLLGARTVGAVTIYGGTYQDATGHTIIDGFGNYIGPVNCSSLQVSGTTVQLFSHQTGPGSVSFTTVADVQTWCIALLTQLQATGIIS